MQRHIKGRQHPPTKHAVRYDTRAYLGGQQTTRPGVSLFLPYSADSPHCHGTSGLARTSCTRRGGNDTCHVDTWARGRIGTWARGHAGTWAQLVAQLDKTSTNREVLSSCATPGSAFAGSRPPFDCPSLATCAQKARPPLFGKGGLCDQDRRLQAQVAYERREAGPGTSPPAPRDRPHRCRRAGSEARRGRPCPR